MMTIVETVALSAKYTGKVCDINDFSCFQEQTYQQDLLICRGKEIRKEIINIINEELIELSACYHTMILL